MNIATLRAKLKRTISLDMRVYKGCHFVFAEEVTDREPALLTLILVQGQGDIRSAMRATLDRQPGAARLRYIKLRAMVRKVLAQ